MKTSDLQRITRQIIQLPAVPVIVVQLLDLVDDPKTSSGTLAQLLSSDQALTAKTLRLANSSYYAFAQPIKTVQLAISLLGYQTVVGLALSLAFTRSFACERHEDEFDVMAFWEHSLSVAVAARGLARELNVEAAPALFTMGILHDIGKLIIHESMYEHYLAIDIRVRLRGEPSYRAERTVMGANHAEIGSWLCESWRLPAEIGCAVRYHHEPSSGEGEAICIIHLADFICNRLGYTWPEAKHAESEFDLVCKQRLGLQLGDNGDVDWQHYDDLVATEIEKAAEFINIVKAI
ncbi:MAG: HDOD domain-containing protein [Candidatus Cloacimonetes bacterium]|nr:HDOD domain-containing protein [Candidatus Cloacimonadota bacterium]